MDDTREQKGLLFVFLQVLNSLTYDNRAEEPTGDIHNLTITVNDGKFSASSQVIVTSLPINDLAPILNLDGNRRNFGTEFVENQPQGIPVAGNVNLTDLDGMQVGFGVFVPSYVTVELQAMDADDELLMYDNVPQGHSMNFSAQSIAEFEDRLGNITYLNKATQPSDGPRYIHFQACDHPSQCSAVAVTTVIILPVNDAPSVVLRIVSITFQEGMDAVRLAPNLTVSDVDNTTLASATVQLENVLDGDKEVLLVNTSLTTISMQTNRDQDTVWLRLNGIATLSEYERVLRTVQYDHQSMDNPTSGRRNVTFEISDGLDSSEPDAVAVSVAPINDAPLLDLNGPNQAGRNFRTTFVEDSSEPAFLFARDFVLSDPDSDTLSNVTVALAMGVYDREENITFTPAYTSNITASYRSSGFGRDGEIVLTLLGPAGIDEFREALSFLVYSNTAIEPDGGERFVRVSANDGQSSSDIQIVNITVNNTNDPPFVDLDVESPGDGHQTTYRENSSPVKLVGNPQIVDPDHMSFKLFVTLSNHGDGSQGTHWLQRFASPGDCRPYVQVAPVAGFQLNPPDPERPDVQQHSR